jgi:hypothetical protein
MAEVDAAETLKLPVNGKFCSVATRGGGFVACASGAAK